MSTGHWSLIALLAAAALAIRLTGLLAGERILRSRHAALLDDLPGLIVVALVGASLAQGGAATWAAAGVAALVAWRARDVILTMLAGVAAYALLTHAGF